MPEQRSLSDEEFVRVVIEEVGVRPLSVLNQIVYLLESGGATSPRFRFTFQPFLGVRDPRVDGLAQSAKVSLMLGRNGIPASSADGVRERIRRLVALLPEHEHDLRLVAVADLVQRQGWHERSKLSVEEVLDSARRQFAPDARLETVEALERLTELKAETDAPAVLALA
jgi:hypothetical protein